MEPLNLRGERHRVSGICWGLVFLLLVTNAADIVLMFLAVMVDPVVALSMEGMSWIAAAAQFLLGYPVCLLMLARIPAYPMETYRLRPGQITDAAFACCFLLVAGSLLGQAVSGIISEILGYKTWNIVSESISSTSLFYNLVTTVVAAPVCEELVCRKEIIDRMNRLGDRPAILVSALLFALLHGNFYQFFYAFGVGLVLGYIYARTGMIRYTIGLHMAINLLCGVLPDVWYQLGGDAASILWELLLLAAAAVGLVRFIVRWHRPRRLGGWWNMAGDRGGGSGVPQAVLMSVLRCSVALFVLYLM
ncbi:MAG: CPBP family intramembrane metalloprotease [Lachnospiraceae bacterium]|nr:CPBP family intramembrane metalloprotease [Lachnospiraceae bacterium]